MLARALKEKILKFKAKIGIVGLGYVGLPLAVEFAKAGFDVCGIDLDQKRTGMIKEGKSYILDVPTEDVRKLVKSGRLSANTEYEVCKKMDVIIICVPTPLRKTKEPDISYIVNAAKGVAKYLHRGQIVVLESTSYPGTTEEVLLPRFQRNGFKLDRDFFLAFSPERVDPANKQYSTKDIPKVVGGITPASTEVAKTLYEQIVPRVIVVSSSRVAEMVKLLENTFRSVNIGLVNEMALMCDRLGIDVWEVIEAAKTKPFGFMPFYPGPGLGGECIPADPIYLSWKARMHGFEARFIELAHHMNSYMPYHVVRKIAFALNGIGKPLKDAKVLILGVAYKKDVSDTREAPAREIMRLLEEEWAKVVYHDPYVPQLRVNGKIFDSVKLTKQFLAERDCAVIVTDHSALDYEFILDNSRLIVDTRNALCNIQKHRERIVKL